MKIRLHVIMTVFLILARYQEEYDKEIERTNKRNEWKKQLLESLE